MIGGKFTDGQVTNRVCEYDAIKWTLTEVSVGNPKLKLAHGRSGHFVVTANNTIFLIGGGDSQDTLIRVSDLLQVAAFADD